MESSPITVSAEMVFQLSRALRNPQISRFAVRLGHSLRRSYPANLCRFSMAWIPASRSHADKLR